MPAKRLAALILAVLAALPLAALPKIACIGASAVFPGTGELLLGKSNRGAVLLGSELIALTSYLATGEHKDDLIKSYKQYALTYAGVPVGNDERYYQHIQQYLSSDEFNQFQELMARNYYLIYYYDPDGFAEYIAANTYGEDEAWRWQSDKHFRKYRSLRSKTQRTRMYQNLSLGFMLLNRAVSMIDVAFIRPDAKTPTPLYFTPLDGGGVALNCRLEF
jgi:hypothetical protein